MDPSTPAETPFTSTDATEFVRFCYRRRRVGWPELYDEMCAVAGRGLYRGWRFAELEERGIGFSLHQTLELARIAAQVAVEEGDRHVRSTGRTASRVASAASDVPVMAPAASTTEPLVAVEPAPSERFIDVRILTAPLVPDGTSATTEPAPGVSPAAGPPVVSSPSRPALSPSLIRSAAGAG